MKACSVLVVVLFVAVVVADSCSDSCDAKATGANVTFCGTDFESHNTGRSSISCYLTCQIGVLYFGTCGCPNDCYASVGRGACNVEEDKCECSSGRGGADCSAIRCPNDCSSHGVCATAQTGDDVCQCFNGYTGSDCATEIPDILRQILPFGQLVAGDYYKNDNYGDDHPVFNLSSVPTVKIYIDPKDWADRVVPRNLYNQTYANANFTFNNGAGLSKTLLNVGYRVKGAVSRSGIKKSWSVKFNTEKGRDWKNLKGLGLKTGTGSTPVSNQLVLDFYRALNIPTYRNSYAELYVNDIYAGLYTMQEKFDDQFMKSRYNAKNNYLFKIGHYDLKYYGTNITQYLALSFSFSGGDPISCIEESVGDGNWTSFLTLLESLNISKTATSAFSSYTNQAVDLDNIVRALMLESFVQNFDGYCGLGNNYFLANTATDADATRWAFIGQDFDYAIATGGGGGGGGGGGAGGAAAGGPPAGAAAGGPPAGAAAGGASAAGGGAGAGAAAAGGAAAGTGRNTTTTTGRGGGGGGGGGGMNMSPNVFTFVTPNKPLTNAIFSLPGTNESFIQYMKLLLKGMYEDHPDLLMERLRGMAAIAAPAIALDNYYSASGTANVSTFLTAVNNTASWITARYNTVLSQVDLPPNNPTTNHLPIIIGCSVGGAVLIAAAVFGVVVYRKRKYALIVERQSLIGLEKTQH